MKKLVIAAIVSVFVVSVVFFGLPAFAQTYVAIIIPGQPLSRIAAEQIITDSGLPIEQLEGGVTNSLTKGRDAVNAYRYAHTMLYKKGWYRGISEDHTPLLMAMVGVLEKEGYTSTKVVFQEKSAEILQKFWYASDTQNAKELGFSNLEALFSEIDRLNKIPDVEKANMLWADFESKWR